MASATLNPHTDLPLVFYLLHKWNISIAGVIQKVLLYMYTPITVQDTAPELKEQGPVVSKAFSLNGGYVKFKNHFYTLYGTEIMSLIE